MLGLVGTHQVFSFSKGSPKKSYQMLRHLSGNKIGYRDLDTGKKYIGDFETPVTVKGRD